MATARRRTTKKVKIKYVNKCKNCGKFAKEYPIGKYAITMNGHITALIDGVIYDTFDCRDRVMRCAWRIE